MSNISIADPYQSLPEIMNIWPNTITVFIRYRMHCVGCLVALFHTVTDACLEYGLAEVAFRVELHRAAKQKISRR